MTTSRISKKRFYIRSQQGVISVLFRDIAVMDEEAYVQIVGRIKDLIIRGGENIYPTEIEQFLYKHPKIADVQVLRAV